MTQHNEEHNEERNDERDDSNDDFNGDIDDDVDDDGHWMDEQAPPLTPGGWPRWQDVTAADTPGHWQVLTSTRHLTDDGPGTLVFLLPADTDAVTFTATSHAQDDYCHRPHCRSIHLSRPDRIVRHGDDLTVTADNQEPGSHHNQDTGIDTGIDTGYE